MAKKKKDEDTMDRPIDVLDKLSDKSLELNLSKEEWLDYLKGFRDELDIQIENVEQELE